MAKKGQTCVDYECVEVENAGSGGPCPEGQAERCNKYE